MLFSTLFVVEWIAEINTGVLFPLKRNSYVLTKLIKNIKDAVTAWEIYKILGEIPWSKQKINFRLTKVNNKIKRSCLEELLLFCDKQSNRRVYNLYNLPTIHSPSLFSVYDDERKRITINNYNNYFISYLSLLGCSSSLSSSSDS